jgi:hypothetical protein
MKKGTNGCMYCEGECTKECLPKEEVKTPEKKRLFNNDEVVKLMTLAFEQGFRKYEVVEAGLEAKETDVEVRWIFHVHKDSINENNL